MPSHKKQLNWDLLCRSLVILLALSAEACLQYRRNKGMFGYGATNRFQEEIDVPEGMVFVPAGIAYAANTGDDIFSPTTGEDKKVTISPFFMSKTPVTVAQYKDFLDYVKEKAEEHGPKAAQDQDDDASSDDTNLTSGDANDDANGDADNQDPTQTNSAEEPQEETPYDFLNNHYKSLYGEDLTADGIEKNLFPDTTVWDRVTPMAGETMREYFTNDQFGGYPVVGITYKQAKFYCAALTISVRKYRQENNLSPYPSDFTLPNKYQWEYAALGGREMAKYPWGGPYIRDINGEVHANFVSSSGDYRESGYTYTCPVDWGYINEYGLVGMVGNVKNWTSSTRGSSGEAGPNSFLLDPTDKQNGRIQIVKGGSWKDVSRYLQVTVDDFAHADSVTTYIGFRCIMPYIGMAEVAGGPAKK